MIRATLSLWAVLAAFLPLAAQELPAPHTPPSVVADDPKPGLAPVETIRMPDVEAQQPPPVPVAVGTPIRLTLNNVYVFDATAPIVVRASPEGLVKITKETGPPVRIRDVFADNPSGRKTTRTFTGKEVYIVEALAGKKGLCDITAIPLGLKEAREIKHKTVDVDGGQAPIPPPGPTPTPTPTPTPIPESVNPFGDDGPFRVLMVFQDKNPPPAGQMGVLYGKTVRDYLDAHCPKRAEDNQPEYRIWDVETKGVENETVPWQTVWKRPRAQDTWIAIGNGKAGYEGPLPKDPVAALELLKKYGGP